MIVKITLMMFILDSQGINGPTDRARLKNEMAPSYGYGWPSSEILYKIVYHGQIRRVKLVDFTTSYC